MLSLRRRYGLGIDIGSRYVKLIEITESASGYLITAASAVPIEYREDESDPAALDIAREEALSRLISKVKLHTKKAITCVSSSQEDRVTMLSGFLVPDVDLSMPRETILASAGMEAESQARVPFPIAESITDCEVFGERELNGRSGVNTFFVAAHRDFLNNISDMIESIGLIPIVVDVDLLALIRLLIFTGQVPDDDIIAVADIGASKTSLIVLNMGYPHLFPHIPTGGDEMTQRIALASDLSWGEAESLKLQNASLTDESEVRREIEKQLEEWQGIIPQIQSRLDFYRADFPEQMPSRIVISGGASQMPGLEDYIARRLDIFTERISYLDMFSVDPKVYTDKLYGNQAMFATAVGLALRQLWRSDE